MQEPDSKKIAIIGAGTVGLYLAWKLSEAGHEVAVMEAKESIGKLSCSGLVSDRILNFVPGADEFAENKINVANIRFPKRTVKLTFTNNFLAVNREKFDQYLAQKAKKAKAEISLGERVEKLPAGYDFIIGCDGAESVVRKKLNLKDAQGRLGIRGYSDEASEKKTVDTWPVEDGFVWKIPRGEKTEYGILADKKKAAGLLDEFLVKRDITLKDKAADLVEKGLALGEDDSIALCGEAAGLTKAWSGGGVIWGLTAADFFLENFPNLEAYRKKVRWFFGPRIAVTNFITNLVYFAGFNFHYILPTRFKVDSDFIL